MIPQNIARIALLSAVLLIAASPPLAARQWSDTAVLTFSAPVRVPGAILPAGTYRFELLDPSSSADVVKITDRQTAKVYALTPAIPTIRPDRTEDVVLLFTATDTGSMPAIRGWFPPGRRHGYLLVYDNDEARLLADRTKSVVLSRNVSDSEGDAATIVSIAPGGVTSAWVQDPDTQREWDDWAAPDRKTVSPIVADAPRGQQVEIDDVDDHPERYFWKTLSIDGTVDEIYGPHLFELEEPDWGQADGDVLVFLPGNSPAALREDDRITVTGILKPFSRSNAIYESRWLNIDDIMERQLDREPVLVATRVVGGDNDRAVTITPNLVWTMTPEGLAPPISDLRELGDGDLALVGRRVVLPSARIESLNDSGFFVRSGDSTMFVMCDPDAMRLRAGDVVTLEGVALAFPSAPAADLKVPSGTNKLYVYAQSVRSRR